MTTTYANIITEAELDARGQSRLRRNDRIGRVFHIVWLVFFILVLTLDIWAATIGHANPLTWVNIVIAPIAIILTWKRVVADRRHKGPWQNRKTSTLAMLLTVIAP